MRRARRAPPAAADQRHFRPAWEASRGAPSVAPPAARRPPGADLRRRATATLVAGHGELARPRLDLGLERAELVRRLLLLERLEEVDELLARLGLRLESDLQPAVEEVADLLEVLLLQAA